MPLSTKAGSTQAGIDRPLGTLMAVELIGVARRA